MQSIGPKNMECSVAAPLATISVRALAFRDFALGHGNDVVQHFFIAGCDAVRQEQDGELQARNGLVQGNTFLERTGDLSLDSGGNYQWRADGEYHLLSPMAIHKLQRAVRTTDYAVFKEYSALINDQDIKHATLRGMLKFKSGRAPISIDEVEPIENILHRFKTGAMSFGSISQEAHETLAIAMNRIGGKSNTGEGGEDA